MCLPPDVVPSLLCTGRTCDGNAGQWAVDQRPFIWIPASNSSKKAKGPLWNSLAETLHGGPLPYAGSAGAGVSGEPLGGPLNLDGSFRASAVTPVELKEGEALKSKKWDGPSTGRESSAVMKSVVCSPPSHAASGVENPTQGSVGSCTSSPSVAILIPVVRGCLNHVHSWERPRSKEEGSVERSLWVKDLIEEDQMPDSLAREFKLSSSSRTCSGKNLRITTHKPKHCKRTAVSQKEIATPTKSVCTSSSLSDNEHVSDDEGEGGAGAREKRRKRMLSNRASAQRSRQRRQDRLDTLEVLVAQLRVENETLSRKANNAAAAAKKFEEENQILRDRLRKQECIPLSDSDFSNESEKTIQNSDRGDGGKDGLVWRVLKAEEAKTNELSTAQRWESIGPGHANKTDHDRSSHVSCRASKSEDGDVEKQAQEWNNATSGGSFSYVFSSDPMETEVAIGIDRRSLSRAPPTADKILHEIPQDYAGLHLKDMYLSSALTLPQTPSFQGLDPFGIVMEQGRQEMDRKNLDPRSAEEIWVESLADCLN